MSFVGKLASQVHMLVKKSDTILQSSSVRSFATIGKTKHYQYASTFASVGTALRSAKFRIGIIAINPALKFAGAIRYRTRSSAVHSRLH